MSIRRIGLLTGGGDCPGLNAAIRSVVRTAISRHGLEVVGFRYGWGGVLRGESVALTRTSVQGILQRGGTILGSASVDPYREGGPEVIRDRMRGSGIDAIIALGGEGTLSSAARLAADGIPVIGIPKTIDNDLAGTDASIGFATAVQVATDAIDRLHTTAESHDRIMVVEVMGRTAGWIAVDAGIAGGANEILIPEVPFDLGVVGARLRGRHGGGHSFSIVVVAEGARPVTGTLELPEDERDPLGYPRFGGIAQRIAPVLARETGYESRVTVLGHVQRGGSPVAADRMLAIRFGQSAVDLVVAGGWGRMVGLRGDAVVDTDLADGSRVRPVPPEHYRIAEVFLG